MKILHIADTHLGFSAYRRTTEDGVNQREMDIYNVFEQFIDYAVNTKPDIIIHAGDLFDSVRPNNRAITFALKQINRLSKEGILFVLIAGNHEHPKLKETGHIFSIFDNIENVYPVYCEKYEAIPLVINNYQILIHALPHTSSKDKFSFNLDELKPDNSYDFNILTVHGAVKAIKEFAMNEFNELFIPVEYLSSNFDYIALGHYHKYTEVSKNAFYPGSTEGLTFNDSGEKKGFIEIKLENGKLNQVFIPLKIRRIVDIEPIDCKNIILEDIIKSIKDKIKKIIPDDKIVRITLNNISSPSYRGIDFREIRRYVDKAMHFEIRANIIQDKNSGYGMDMKINSLSDEFKNFVNKQDMIEKEAILELGLKYIEKIDEREEKG